MSNRIAIGIWVEWSAGYPWTNEGMTRLLGYLIEGLAKDKQFIFRIVVQRCVYVEARGDLLSLNAVEGEDFTIHQPDAKSVLSADDDLLRSIDLANSIDDVVGWIPLYPHFENCVFLKKPIIPIFPDAIPIEFPTFGYDAWEDEGEHTLWRARVQKVLNAAARVITFSEHVAEKHAVEYFRVPKGKIAVVPMAAPDLSGLLPFVHDGRKTRSSKQKAGAILRDFAAQREWEYLSDFPFEDVNYVVCATQDRPTKNLILVARAVEFLLRRDHFEVKFITTAPIHYGADWTRLPGFISGQGLELDILSMQSLPRIVHSALYHCALATIHPAIFEGGTGSWPLYESVGLGTPCLLTYSRHVREMAMQEPDFLKWAFDPSDHIGLAGAIRDISSTGDSVLVAQRQLYERVKGRGWDAVAREYCNAVVTESLDAIERVGI